MERRRRGNSKVDKRNTIKLMIALGFCVAVLIVFIVIVSALVKAGEKKTVEVANKTVAISFVSEESYIQPEDPLLVLVNDEYAIPDDYSTTLIDYGDGVQVSETIYTPLSELLNDIRDSGLSLWIASSYRSAKEQKTILENAVTARINSENMTESDAREDALKSISLPRHSEHETGLAVDFNTVSADFEDTEEFKWLKEHAADYGFVLRYPKDKESITGIIYESWHYRYVGKENAAAMESLGMCLEEYDEYVKNP